MAQLARPHKLVAVELAANPCTPLETFIDARGLRAWIATYYGVDQSDVDRLRTILDHEYPGEALDLVVDDSVASGGPDPRELQCVVSAARSGRHLSHRGLVMGARQWCAVAGAWAKRTPLSVFIFELMLVCAHHPTVIEEIVVKKGSAFIRRGPRRSTLSRSMSKRATVRSATP